jgi:uncharacterized damage-inducible protein DinB
MESRDLAIDALGRVDEDLRRCLEGLSAEQLAFRPDPEANSIAWLAWHLTRVQDDHVSDLARQPQAWIADGWHARFGRPADPHDVGFGHTAAQVATLRPESPDVLVDYFEAVHRRSIAYLRTVTAEDLDRELDEPQWETPVTVGVRLVSVVNDCTQHVGQMAYIRGLIERRHWLPY